MIKQSSDLALIGGGLAGLCTAIRLAKANLRVSLFEKKQYPFHRVCGEYISKETLSYLSELGFNPYAHGASDIMKLQVSGTGKAMLKADLDLGGFGLSRYKMDEVLAGIAKDNGVQIHENTTISDIKYENGISVLIDKNGNEYYSRFAIGAQGKRSLLDQSLKRDYLKKRSPYLGVKYHLKYDQAKDLIALHNFSNGYCGISAIEDDKYCLCYLVRTSELKKAGSISELEKKVLSKNKHLKRIFNEAEFIYDKPLVINEITFAKKSLSEDKTPMIGDAAGMITPLCGNGMAMAIHSSKLFSDTFLDNPEDYFNSYKSNWNKHFDLRLKIGRTIQSTFGQNSITNLTLGFFNTFPPLKNKLISLTHGEEF